MKRSAFFIMVSFCVQIFASNVNISLNPEDWSEYRTYTDPYTKTTTPEGYLRVTSNKYRGNVNLKSDTIFNLQNATLRYKWLVNNGSVYGATGDGPNGISTLARPFFSTHHSWAGSIIINSNTWIYTEVIVNPDKTWSYDYSYTGYGEGGISHGSSTASDTIWEAFGECFIHKNIGDTYLNSSYFDIAEAYLIKAGPSLEIIEPQESSYFQHNELITFSANIIDGDNPYELSWESDIDGIIGNGDSFDIDNLSLGNHEITVTYTDNLNADINSSFSINIIEQPKIENIANLTISNSSSYVSQAPIVYQGNLATVWSLVQGPDGMIINEETGQVTWSPTTDGSPFNITIRVENPVGFDEISWEVSVIETPQFATTIWSKIQDGNHGEDGSDAYYRTAFDNEGNIYAAGYMDSTAGMMDAAFLIKYSTNGDIIWSKTIDVPYSASKAEYNDRFTDVDVDSENNVIVVGSRSGTFTSYYLGSYHNAVWVQKYSPDGETILWEKIWHERSSSAWQGAYGVFVDQNDSIYVTGNSFEVWGGAEHKWVTLKYDKNGNLVLGPISHNSLNSYHLPDIARDVVADSNGDIFVVGYVGISPVTSVSADKNTDMRIIKFSGVNGAILWSDTYSGSTNRIEYGLGLTLDPDENVLAVGLTNSHTNNTTPNYDWIMIKYDNASGERLWTQTYESRLGASEACYDAVSDDNGDFYVAGYMKNESDMMQRRIAKISGIDGTTMAEAIWDTEEESYFIGIDISGNLLSAAGLLHNGNDYDAFVSTLTVELAVQITEPSAGAYIEHGQPVQFEAELAGGAEPPYYFSWESNIDGNLGTGQSLEANNLSLGEHLVTCRLDYAETQSIQTTIRINIISAPEIEVIEDITIAEGEPFISLAPILNDGVGEVEWVIIDGPDGMTINNSTGVIGWNVPLHNISGYNITVGVSNVAGNDQSSFKIYVLERPIIQNIGDQVIKFGSSYVSSEPVLLGGSLPIAWELIDGPSGMEINFATGQLNWPLADVEDDFIIKIRATNPASYGEVTFKLTVQKPPVLDNIADSIIELDTLYNFSVNILEGTLPLTWELLDAPNEMTINNGIVSWASPSPKDSVNSITVKVSNTVGNDTKTYKINVLEKPLIENIETLTIHEGSRLELVANLLEGSLPIEWELVSGPINLSINESNGSIVWPKVIGQHSPYSVTLMAKNAIGESSKSFAINVLRPPVIIGIPDVIVAESSTYTSIVPGLYQGSAPITWSLIDGPDEMNIDTINGVLSWNNVIYREDPYTINIKAENVVNEDTESWTLKVIQSPMIAEIDNSIAADNTVYNGPLPNLTQGTRVTWSLLEAPVGMTINSTTGQVRWANPIDTGNLETVTLQASNIAGSNTESFSINVLASPVINNIEPQMANEYEIYTGPKPELIKGDYPVTWSLLNAPEGITIDNSTGIISWDLPFSVNGTHPITIKAENSVGHDTLTWQLEVPIGYNVTVDADIDSASAGTQINLNGEANWLYRSGSASNVPINLGIEVQGMMRKIETTTNENGQFSAVFNPLINEAGFYSVYASHPKEGFITEQDNFKLYGLVSEINKKSHTLKPGEIIQGQIKLTNPGDLPLSEISYEIIDAAENIQFTADIPTYMDALSDYTVNYEITATDSSISYDVLNFNISSKEGAFVEIQYTTKVVPLEYNIRFYPESLEAGMVRGQNNIVQFEVYNTGGAASENMDVLIPNADWLTLSSPKVINAIEPDDVELVSLQLTPTIDMPLGVYSGEIIVYGGGISKHIPFNFNCVSDAVGEMQITVTDEFTYYAEGQPNVKDARITLINSITSELVATAITDNTGIVTFDEIPEAYYEVIIDEQEHGAYRNIHYVMPGVTNRITAFMPRNLVKYKWTVLETEIQDHYKLVLDTIFETTVPAPVITIEPAKIDLAEMQGPEMYVDFVITNHGMVSADNAFIRFDENDRYEVELLSDYYGEIMPKETITVPAIIRDTQYIESLNAMDNGILLPTDTSDECERNFKGKVYYRLVCGDDGKWKTVPVYIGFWTCPKDIKPTKPTNPPGKPKDPVPTDDEDEDETETNKGSGRTPVSKPNSSSGGGGGSGGGSSPNTPYITFGMIAGNIVGTECDPCPGKRYDAFVGCAISFLPLDCPLTVLKAAWDISNSCTSKGAWSFDCLKNVVGGVVGAATSCVKNATSLTPLGIGYNIAWCLYDISSACDNLNASSFEVGISKLEELTAQDLDDIPMNDQTAALMYQQAQQLEKMLDGLTVVFGDPIWFSGTDVKGDIYWNLMQAVSASIDETGDMGQKISETEQESMLNMQLPSQMNAVHIFTFCERWNRSLDYWEMGKYTSEDLEPGDETDFIDATILNDKSTEAAQAAEDTIEQGFENMFDGAHYAQQEFVASIDQGTEGICAKVKIQIKQDAVMTRTAFNASLELENESERNIENVLVEIKITDEYGNDATNLFGIYPPSLSGISYIDGSDTLTSWSNAKAEWIILPTNEAAPDSEKTFYVGATLSYHVDGLEVNVPIHPDSINVKPEAQLYIKYFHQKDVYSDDPFTDEIEPAEAYSLGMMITNTGGGPARNVQITSAQPQIIRAEQDKDILIDFEIIDATLNGNKMLDSFAVNMGDITSGETSIARWQMKSSLQGQFISYNASFEHINGLGDARLSLIQGVEIHELIHCVREDDPIDDNIADFMTNDLADANSLPDTLYTSTGAIENIESVLDAQVNSIASETSLEVELNATVPDGNVYIRLDNPCDEDLRLAYVIRSDGKFIIPEYNAWTTDRMIRKQGQENYRERLLHIFDKNSTGLYTLVYTTIQNPLSITNVTLKSDPIATIDVEFNVQIDPTTFNWNDVELTRNYGKNLIDYPITIRQITDSTFRISGLAYLTYQEGRYELKINTENITSINNIAGVSVKSIVWTRTLQPWNINSDDIVNLSDLATIAKNWTDSDCDAPTWCDGADINRDHNVNIFDIIIICEHWLDTID